MKVLAIEKEYEDKIKDDFLPHLEIEAKIVWDLYKKE